MTLAVVFALDAESAPWRARHRLRPVEVGGRRAFDGEIGAVRARVVLSGIGAPHPAALLDAALTPETTVVLVAGLAGALGPGFAVGDIVVARRMREAGSPAVTAADAGLVALAVQCGARAVEAIVSSPRLARVADKARLAAEGDVVDMESFAVAGEAARRGVRAVVIRAIGDLADEELPLDFMPAVRPDGSLSAARVAVAIARRPRLPALLGFAVRQTRAIGRLADFLDVFVPRLGAPARS